MSFFDVWPLRSPVEISLLQLMQQGKKDTVEFVLVIVLLPLNVYSSMQYC